MKDHRKERAEARKKAEKLVSQMTLLEKASQLKYDAAPVKDDFLKLPYPVTTTSSNTSVSGFSVIFTTGLIATSTVCIPIYEICKVFAELQLYHNFFIIRVL